MLIPLRELDGAVNSSSSVTNIAPLTLHNMEENNKTLSVSSLEGIP